ncbi:hypothetical protein [Haloarcula sp. JP-L23]|uniref:DUF7344 domain-containing protein n=1 Tax=Haloarcula sp. JP-L23 TaxID=2716717 RepID=UPI00140F2BF1|nr:hypothetical protein G9465_05565 [Haloarcula sp. JP-L23]
MGGDNGNDDIPGIVEYQRRRHLLYCLCLSSTPLPLAGVADQLTVWETGDSPDDRPDGRLRIYMSLYHDHLPPLVEADVVDYRQEADTVDWATDPPRNRVEAVLERHLTADIEDLLQAETETFDDGSDETP